MNEKRSLSVNLNFGKSREHYSTNVEVIYNMDESTFRKRRDVIGKPLIRVMELDFYYYSGTIENAVLGFIPLLENFLKDEVYPIDFIRLHLSAVKLDEDEAQALNKGIEELIKNPDIKKIDWEGINELK